VSKALTAYFCAEFALSPDLPVYSGGLGVLAGDHLKAADDLRVPLVAVGIAYRDGYFTQRLSPDGWQEEHYENHAPEDLPLTPALEPDGAQVRVSLDLPGRQAWARIWRADVGTVPVVLLDLDIPENAAADRLITRRLYGGDVETRILQEMVLGIGGMRALRALGYRPRAFHLNEGHAAFLLLERIRELVEDEKLPFEEARRRVAATSIFTTHTPIPAGFDLFSPGLMHTYFAHFATRLGLNWETLMRMGRRHPQDDSQPFNMALFAVRNTAYRNGVSRLHGRVSRAMWHEEWPDRTEDAVPIGYVTNGVHGPRWVGPEMAALLDRHLGPGWAHQPERADWARVLDIPDRELWEVRGAARRRLIDVARRRLGETARRLGAGDDEAVRAGAGLDPEALTIGFARRFAPYKRATLLLREPDRLLALLADAGRPVQFLFAGKSHPANFEGKHLIQEIVHFSRDPAAAGRVVFLENYDLELAAALVQGADVWLNTPRRPQEASGTSGMKAVMNGGLHLSVRDGWWDEGYAPDLGWAIGDGEEAGDQDALDADSLYRLLETEIIPGFHEREAGVPVAWVARVKRSLARLSPAMSAHRMVREYAERYYGPAGSGDGGRPPE